MPATRNKGKSVRKISLAVNHTDGNMMDFEVIPDDVWLSVFEHLDSTELGRLALTCRKFYNLTQKPLLKELTWAKSGAVLQNIRDWGESLAGLTPIPRKVRVLLSMKAMDIGSVTNIPDWELYDKVHHRLLSFNNLRTLELSGTIITPAFYPVLAGLFSLRELNITQCTFVWTPIYHSDVPSLGRLPVDGASPGGRSTAASKEADRVAIETQFIENRTFDFGSLQHITKLSFHHNRMPQSEMERPAILHPLYLLSVPSIRELSLTWSTGLMQVFAALKQSPNPNLNVNLALGTLANIPHHNHAALGLGNLPAQTLLHAHNSHGVDLFHQLVATFQNLEHLTLVIEELSRDLMDSVVNMFEGRIHSATNAAPLKIILNIQKHTLTEQHLASVQFPLHGVYSYSGPMSIAGLLTTATSGNANGVGMEEVRMTESMDPALLLFAMEKLPRSLKVLEVRVYHWDQEILYASRMLFKELTELVIKYGKGSLKENFHITLGSDILPDLKHLRTLKILECPDCIKREQQFRFPLVTPHHTNWHAHHHQHHHQHQHQPQQTNNQIQNVITMTIPNADEDGDDSSSDGSFNDAIASVGGGGATAAGSSTQTPIPTGIVWLSTTTLANANANNNNNNNNNNVVANAHHQHPYLGWSASHNQYHDPGSPHIDWEEQRKIVKGLRDDLGDYLVGWNRHCSELRVVQMEHRVLWERRFEGDAWVRSEKFQD